MPRRVSRTEIRTTTAYHEAAHAVVAARYGWFIIEPGIRIDLAMDTQFCCRAFERTAPAQIAVSLAGELAARVHHGVRPCGRNSRADFDVVYDDIKEEWGEFEGMSRLMLKS